MTKNIIIIVYYDILLNIIMTIKSIKFLKSIFVLVIIFRESIEFSIIR